MTLKNIGLWKNKDILKFWSKPNSGDSSFIEICDSVGTSEVSVDRLDSQVLPNMLNNYERVVLKVEAEGAEPEVLIGAVGMLEECDYVTVDCGPERGMKGEHTFMEVYNFMASRNFKLEEVYFDRVEAIFKKT